MNPCASLRSLRSLASVLLGSSMLLCGCDRRPELRLSVIPAELAIGKPVRLSVDIFNPPAGLRFDWESQEGSFDVKSSPKVYTQFTPTMPGVATITLRIVGAQPRTPDIRLRSGSFPVTLEPVSGEGVLFRGRIALSIPGGPSHPPAGESSTPSAQPDPNTPAVSITSRNLPLDPVGGGDSTALVNGRVHGPIPPNARIVLYVLTDNFYVQPLTVAPFTAIDSEGKWFVRSHVGRDYAALLVTDQYKPNPVETPDFLSRSDPDVLAVSLYSVFKDAVDRPLPPAQPANAPEPRPATIPLPRSLPPVFRPDPTSGLPAPAPRQPAPSFILQPGDPAVNIEILNAPDEEPGDTPLHPISGKVRGVKADEVKVVIYAYSDRFYVQPWAAAPFTAIKADLTWLGQTRGGYLYLGLLVKPTFKPPATLSVPPEVGGDILAVTLKERPGK